MNELFGISKDKNEESIESNESSFKRPEFYQGEEEGQQEEI
jgi:hypothetical protein